MLAYFYIVNCISSNKQIILDCSIRVATLIAYSGPFLTVLLEYTTIMYTLVYIPLHS